MQSDKLVAWSFQERFEYSGKFSDRQDQKECSMIKRQKLQTYSPHLFLAPIPYLQKMDNITWREKVWLLPITTQHICVFQKNVVKYLTGTNHNFSEVMANLPLPRSELCCILVWLDYGRWFPYAPQTLCNSNPLTWTESLLTSLVPESASTSPPLMEGDGTDPFSFLHEPLGSH